MDRNRVETLYSNLWASIAMWLVVAFTAIIVYFYSSLVSLKREETLSLIVYQDTVITYAELVINKSIGLINKQNEVILHQQIIIRQFERSEVQCANPPIVI